jgi:hypothetical protein
MRFILWADSIIRSSTGDRQASNGREYFVR